MKIGLQKQTIWLTIVMMTIIGCVSEQFQSTATRNKRRTKKHTTSRINRKLKKQKHTDRYHTTIGTRIHDDQLSDDTDKQKKVLKLKMINDNYHRLQQQYYDQQDNDYMNDEEAKSKDASVDSKQCQVELKDNSSNQQGQTEAGDDKQNQQTNESDNEDDICECNVKCIQNCENIKNGVEGLPVSKVDGNKYMIETYEEQNNTCLQSCKENLQKLGCLVKEV